MLQPSSADERSGGKITNDSSLVSGLEDLLDGNVSGLGYNCHGKDSLLLPPTVNSMSPGIVLDFGSPSRELLSAEELVASWRNPAGTVDINIDEVDFSHDFDDYDSFICEEKFAHVPAGDFKFSEASVSGSFDTDWQIPLPFQSSDVQMKQGTDEAKGWKQNLDLDLDNMGLCHEGLADSCLPKTTGIQHRSPNEPPEKFPSKDDSCNQTTSVKVHSIQPNSDTDQKKGTTFPIPATVTIPESLSAAHLLCPDQEKPVALSFSAEMFPELTVPDSDLVPISQDFLLDNGLGSNSEQPCFANTHLGASTVSLQWGSHDGQTGFQPHSNIEEQIMWDQCDGLQSQTGAAGERSTYRIVEGQNDGDVVSLNFGSHCDSAQALYVWSTPACEAAIASVQNIPVNNQHGNPVLSETKHAVSVGKAEGSGSNYSSLIKAEVVLPFDGRIGQVDMLTTEAPDIRATAVIEASQERTFCDSTMALPWVLGTDTGISHCTLGTSQPPSTYVANQKTVFQDNKLGLAPVLDTSIPSCGRDNSQTSRITLLSHGNKYSRICVPVSALSASQFANDVMVFRHADVSGGNGTANSSSALGIVATMDMESKRAPPTLVAVAEKQTDPEGDISRIADSKQSKGRNKLFKRKPAADTVGKTKKKAEAKFSNWFLPKECSCQFDPCKKNCASANDDDVDKVPALESDAPTTLKTPFPCRQYHDKVYICPFDSEKNRSSAETEFSNLTQAPSDEVIGKISTALTLQERSKKQWKEALEKTKRIKSACAVGKAKTRQGVFYCSGSNLGHKTVRQLLQEAGVQPQTCDDVHLQTGLTSLKYIAKLKESSHVNSEEKSSESRMKRKAADQELIGNPEELSTCSGKKVLRYCSDSNENKSPKTVQEENSDQTEQVCLQKNGNVAQRGQQQSVAENSKWNAGGAKECGENMIEKQAEKQRLQGNAQDSNQQPSTQSVNDDAQYGELQRRNKSDEEYNTNRCAPLTEQELGKQTLSAGGEICLGSKQVQETELGREEQNAGAQQQIECITAPLSEQNISEGKHTGKTEEQQSVDSITGVFNQSQTCQQVVNVDEQMVPESESCGEVPDGMTDEGMAAETVDQQDKREQLSQILTSNFFQKICYSPSLSVQGVCDEESTIIHGESADVASEMEDCEMVEMETDAVSLSARTEVLDVNSLPVVEKRGKFIYSETIHDGDIESLYRKPFLLIKHKAEPSSQRTTSMSVSTVCETFQKEAGEKSVFTEELAALADDDTGSSHSNNLQSSGADSDSSDHTSVKKAHGACNFLEAGGSRQVPSTTENSDLVDLLLSSESEGVESSWSESHSIAKGADSAQNWFHRPASVDSAISAEEPADNTSFMTDDFFRAVGVVSFPQTLASAVVPHTTISGFVQEDKTAVLTAGVSLVDYVREVSSDKHHTSSKSHSSVENGASALSEENLENRCPSSATRTFPSIQMINLMGSSAPVTSAESFIGDGFSGPTADFEETGSFISPVLTKNASPASKSNCGLGYVNSSSFEMTGNCTSTILENILADAEEALKESVENGVHPDATAEVWSQNNPRKVTATITCDVNLTAVPASTSTQISPNSESRESFVCESRGDMNRLTPALSAPSTASFNGYDMEHKLLSVDHQFSNEIPLEELRKESREFSFLIPECDISHLSDRKGRSQLAEVCEITCGDLNIPGTNDTDQKSEQHCIETTDCGSVFQTKCGTPSDLENGNTCHQESIISTKIENRRESSHQHINDPLEIWVEDRQGSDSQNIHVQSSHESKVAADLRKTVDTPRWSVSHPQLGVDPQYIGSGDHWTDIATVCLESSPAEVVDVPPYQELLTVTSQQCVAAAEEGMENPAGMMETSHQNSSVDSDSSFDLFLQALCQQSASSDSQAVYNTVPTTCSTSKTSNIHESCPAVIDQVPHSAMTDTRQFCTDSKDIHESYTAPADTGSILSATAVSNVSKSYCKLALEDYIQTGVVEAPGVQVFSTPVMLSTTSPEAMYGVACFESAKGPNTEESNLQEHQRSCPPQVDLSTKNMSLLLDISEVSDSSASILSGQTLKSGIMSMSDSSTQGKVGDLRTFKDAEQVTDDYQVPAVHQVITMPMDNYFSNSESPATNNFETSLPTLFSYSTIPLSLGAAIAPLSFSTFQSQTSAVLESTSTPTTASASLSSAASVTEDHQLPVIAVSSHRKRHCLKQTHKSELSGPVGHSSKSSCGTSGCSSTFMNDSVLSALHGLSHSSLTTRAVLPASVPELPAVPLETCLSLSAESSESPLSSTSSNLTVPESSEISPIISRLPDLVQDFHSSGLALQCEANWSLSSSSSVLSKSLAGCSSAEMIMTSSLSHSHPCLTETEVHMDPLSVITAPSSSTPIVTICLQNARSSPLAVTSSRSTKSQLETLTVSGHVLGNLTSSLPLAYSTVQRSENASGSKTVSLGIFNSSSPSALTCSSQMSLSSTPAPSVAGREDSSDHCVPMTLSTCSSSRVESSSDHQVSLSLSSVAPSALWTSSMKFIVTPVSSKRYHPPCVCHPLTLNTGGKRPGLPCIPFSPAMLNCPTMEARPAVVARPDDLPQNPCRISEGVFEYSPSAADIHMAQTMSSNTSEEGTNTSNHSNRKPISFHVDTICIGDFVFTVTNEKYSKASNVGISFQKKKLIYNMVLTNTATKEANGVQQVVVTEISFSSIAGLWGEEDKLLLELNTVPVMYLVSAKTRFSSKVNKHSDIDITGGQLRKVPYHFLSFLKKEGQSIKYQLCKDPFFCRLLVQPVTVNLKKTYSCSEPAADKGDNDGEMCRCQRTACQKGRCRCLVAGRICKGSCSCVNCQNPFNQLQEMRLYSEEIFADKCLMDNLSEMKNLCKFLETPVRLKCCGARTKFVHCVPNLQHCPQCGAGLRLSWCAAQVYIESQLPRHHCEKCKVCPPANKQHCDVCKRCTKRNSREKCIPCQLNASYRAAVSKIGIK